MSRDRPYTTTSLVRVWTRKHSKTIPELMELGKEVTKRNNGRYPCCGALGPEESKKFLEILKENEELRKKIKSEGFEYVALSIDGNRSELVL